MHTYTVVDIHKVLEYDFPGYQLKLILSPCCEGDVIRVTTALVFY
jgi:hypothetical protein